MLSGQRTHAGVRHQPQQQLSSPRVIRTTAHHRPVLPAARRVDLPVRTHCSVSVTETMTAEQPSTSRRTPEKRSGLAGRVASIRNIRDLSESHQPVKKGRVIRCARPADASTGDVSLLLDELRIRDLLDLRSMEEIQEDLPESHLFSRATDLISHKRHWATGVIPPPPTREPPPEGPILHHNVSLLERSRYYAMLLTHVPWRKTMWAAGLRLAGYRDQSRQVLLQEVNNGGLPLLYRMLVDWAKPEIYTALMLVTTALESQRPVMLFCKAGKDRTGLVSAMVLHCAGASREGILDDYVKSDEYHLMALAGIEKTEEMRGIRNDVFARAPREAMASLLDYVDTKYGGLGNYMSHIGFREQQQQRLRDLLTRTDWP